MRVNYRTRLTILRKRNHLTQKDVSALLAVSPRTYCDYETGQCRIPVDKLITLAHYYNVDMNYISGISNLRCDYPTM